MDWPSLIDQMRSGSVLALSRLISLVENREPGWREVMKKLYPLANQAATIGVTGYPGSGKSTLTAKLVRELVDRGNRVGVVAVDPSSYLTGGAFLGDRIRMNELSTLKEVFIRSMSSRGAVGGIHQAARDVIRILDAFGKDYILVETVGVGQDEIAITQTTQVVLLVCAPGQGDGIFNETIEKKWVEQWLFYANSTRFASAMAGADYGAFANGRWYLTKNIQEMVDLINVNSDK